MYKLLSVIRFVGYYHIMLIFILLISSRL